MSALVLLMSLYVCAYVCTINADAGLTNSKDAVDLKGESYIGTDNGNQEQPHDDAVLIGCMTAAIVFGVSAVAVVIWSIHRRLRSVQRNPEEIEMETMLHV